jgi:hypothetical protein
MQGSNRWLEFTDELVQELERERERERERAEVLRPTMVR